MSSTATTGAVTDLGSTGDEGVGGLSADLRVALMRTVRRLRAEKSDDAITDSQYAVLGVLDKHGAMTAAALAAHERIRPPSMTRIVGGLLQAGLVDRQAHPDDKRAQIITLTPAGRETVLETRRRRDEWLCQQLGTLSVPERRTLAAAVDVLKKLAEG